MFLDEFVKRANKIIYEYQQPIQYLEGRGIIKSDIDTFGIGYVKIANIKVEDTIDYVVLKKDTYNFYFLQKKIIFPLRNLLGVVQGLCTRDIEQKKYNQFFLSESKKIGVFFGLYEALPYIFSTRKVFVHEGAIDAISFAKVFPNSISSLTSFLNEYQFEQLKMLCDKIILVYDDDKAGNIGIDKMKRYYGEKVIEAVNIGMDDSNLCLVRSGLEKFKEYIKKRVPLYLQG